MFTSAPRDLAIASLVVIHTAGAYAAAAAAAEDILDTYPMLESECAGTVGDHLYAIIMGS